MEPKGDPTFWFERSNSGPGIYAEIDTYAVTLILSRGGREGWWWVCRSTDRWPELGGGRGVSDRLSQLVDPGGVGGYI